MNTSATDRIERQILLKVPRSRVWRALTRIEEFNRWFGVALEGEAFIAGQRVQGRVTYPGYEHLTFEITIERCEPERLLSWRWHPAALDPAADYSNEPTTLVVFELEEVSGGTLLRVVESGIDGIPLARRLEVFRLNTAGWEEQMVNIGKYVAAN